MCICDIGEGFGVAAMLAAGYFLFTTITNKSPPLTEEQKVLHRAAHTPRTNIVTTAFVTSLGSTGERNGKSGEIIKLTVKASDLYLLL